MAKNKTTDEDVIVIKKYANRRLYNTASSSYVTLEHLCQMVKNGQDFVVYDAKSGEDITRSVLTQIIFEEESKGQNMLPVSFLKKIIGFYGDSLQAVVPNYLDATMDAFSHNQDDMRDYVGQSFGGMFPVKDMEEMGKRNMAFFEQTMRMMNPFLANQDQAANAGAPQAAKEEVNNAPEPVGDALDLLRKQMAEMQNQIEKLAKS